MFINRATRRQAPITAASKINLNSWKLTGFWLRFQHVELIGRRVELTARRRRALSAPFWLLSLFGLRLGEIAGIYILALRTLNVKIDEWINR
jgi:lipid-A-disaccharide synthase-like uncharacterized protein